MSPRQHNRMREAPNADERARRRVVGASHGLTLIEMLIVLALIGLLMALLLPALGGARRSARALTCQSNLRQLGLATRMYLDDQGEQEQRFLDLRPRSPNIADRWYAMVLLGDYLGGNTESPVFHCPSAIGKTSVRLPMNRWTMARSGSVHVYDFDHDQFDEYTEYWFNDSVATTYGELFGPRARNANKPLGVSGQDLLRLEHADSIVWAADAIDWIPRHSNTSNMLMGDQSLQVRALRPPAYLTVEARGPWGAPGPFYNWGHFYPDKYGL